MSNAHLIVKLRGGLGNQLFQYAFARFLVSFIPDRVALDRSSLDVSGSIREYQLSAFQLNGKLPLITLNDNSINSILDHSNQYYRRLVKLFLQLIGPASGYVKDNLAVRERNFFEEVAAKNKQVIFDGYWQQYTYISALEAELRSELQFCPSILDSFESKNGVALKSIENVTKVCIHIRRSDYLQKNSIHLTYGLDFYKAALAKITVPNNCMYLIFSDDISWCRENLHFIEGKKVFVDSNFLPAYSDLNNFILMTQCDHFIIPNSTYSWWAAWLSTSSKNKQIVCPRKWLSVTDDKSIIPPTWTSI